jgi:methylated-DNA-[protein]-cysteine S-methyltransferase
MTIETVAVPSPIGEITIAARAGRVVGLWFSDTGDRAQRQIAARFGPEPHQHVAGTPAADHVRDYFDGDLAALDRVDTDLDGTPFQRRVWTALRDIPAGTTWSYAELAAAVGAPTAFRAVGAANGANPVSLVHPCHRVVATGGGLGGYGGGLSRKEWLLRHEGALDPSLQAIW